MELKEYIQIIIRRIWIPIALTLVFTITSAFVSYYVLEEVYQASTTLYIVNKAEKNVLTYYSFQVSNELVNDYRELIKSRRITSLVIDKMGLTGVSPSAVATKINVNFKAETRVIVVTVEDKSPKFAMDIANTVAEVFMEEVVELLNVENVQVIDKAILPGAPAKPNKQMNIAIAGFLGIMMGLGIIFLLEYFNNTIKTPEDVQKHLNLPLIGVIPLFSNSEGKDGKKKTIFGVKKRAETTESDDGSLITYVSPKSPFSEAYRIVRTNIQFSSIDKPLKVLVVTSAGPREGKTTTASNLAVTFAQSGCKTILIDTDFRKPKVHRVFNLPNSDGIVNAVAMHDIEDYRKHVISSQVENLDIMTAGHIPPNPSEVISSNTMKQVIERIKQDYDIIIMDTPPVSPITDAAILSASADATIFVAASETLEIEMALRAKGHLEKVKANIIGVILNKLSKNTQGNYYYYYNYYYSDEPSEKENKKEKDKKNKKGNTVNAGNAFNAGKTKEG